MEFTPFATSEPFDSASGARMNQFGNELQAQINVLKANTFMGEYCSQNYKGAFITDWNNVVENGLYMSNSATHAPYPDNWFEVQVIAHGVGYTTQIAYRFTDTPVKVFKRNCINGVWQSWGFDSYTHCVFLSLQSGWINMENTNSLISINAPTASIMGRIKSGSTTQYATIATLPFYLGANVGQIIVSLYNSSGIQIGSAIASGNNLTLLHVNDNSDVNFNFSVPMAM